MALNIKNAETERLARELARRRKQGITEVVTDALRKEVERERGKRTRGHREDFVRKLREIGERASRHPAIDPRSEDDVLGYDDMLADPAPGRGG